MTPEERIEALEFRVSELEQALGLTRQFPSEWGMTPTQERILGMLLKADVVTTERIYVALYAGCANPPTSNVIQSQLCYLRAKLKNLGVQVRSIQGSAWGYWIPKDQKALLAQA